MTFLPIVERELRVAARRRGTYWLRLAVALVAILLGGIILLVSLGAPQAKMGQYIFEGLAVLCIVYCLFAGRISTADCLSEEKREGTLGLLFLTDLKGYDVVLGKLVATSLSGFYALLAVLPVLAIPMLLGGITNGEFWRIVLVLVNTFLFSLAVGMFGSALTWEARRAMGVNFGLLLLFVVAIPLATEAVSYCAGQKTGPELMLSSPIFALYLCEDLHYRAEPEIFWWSVGVVHLLTWVLLGLASWIVPRTWQDKPVPAVRTKKIRWRDLWHAWSYGHPAKRGAFRKRLLDVNAYYWLAGRARLKPLHVWTFMGLMCVWWVWGWMGSGIIWFDSIVAVTAAILLNSTLKVWIAIEAGQQLAEDQRANAVELLLVTPLTGRDILRGQFLALRRQFLGPLLVVVAVELIFMAAQVNFATRDKLQLLETWLAGIVMLLVDMVTLSLVGMRVALTAKSLNRATITTVLRMLVLPWVLYGIGVGMGTLWAELFSVTGWVPDWRFNLKVWFGTGMLVNLVFGLSAWRQLRGNFHQLATRRFAPTVPRFAQWFGRGEVKAGQKAEAVAPRFSWRKKKLAMGAVLGVVIAGGFYVRWNSAPKFPPPLVVSMTQSNAPLRVFPGVNVHMILPDGSFWRWGGLGIRQISRAVVPERLEINSDWAQVANSGDSFLGLHKDGTLWEWGWLWGGGRGQNGANQLATTPEQKGAGHDWISASTGAGYAVALKSDGTIWAWGDNSMGRLGNGSAARGSNTTNLVQVGTNSDWVAASAQGSYTLGVRRDGTLWVWGRVQLPGTSTVLVYPAATQVCQETNWAGLMPGLEIWALTKSGEVWQPIRSSPNAGLSVAVTGQLETTNYISEHLAAALCDTPKLYEVRADGTLWERDYSFGWSVAVNEKWRRLGKRSDWVSIWGASGTAIGLTADGTIWTWGIDYSRNPVPDFAAKLAMLQDRIKGIFGGGSSMGGGFNGMRQPYEKEPRPLMRMVAAGKK
ncbi:MAG: hypothetical protein JWR19_3757 [Pedosphaera sp.]|nr:hypothetical protein [Pedosphaera sp.]